jgi:hypothetical protein
VIGTTIYGQEEPMEMQGNVTFLVSGVEDAAGNVGYNVSSVSRVTADRGWVTIDTVVPVITWVDVTSNNAKHAQLAKEGDTIQMTVNASEWIDAPKGVIAARSVETMQPYGIVPHVTHYLFGSCPEYNATITVVGSHEYSQEDPFEQQGNVSVFVYDVEDPAGNVGSNVSAVSRETSSLGWVTIDTIKPKISWLDVTSNNIKHPQLAKGGDTLFVSINSSEWIDEPTVQVNSRLVDSI